MAKALTVGNGLAAAAESRVAALTSFLALLCPLSNLHLAMPTSVRHSYPIKVGVVTGMDCGALAP